MTRVTSGQAIGKTTKNVSTLDFVSPSLGNRCHPVQITTTATTIQWLFIHDKLHESVSKNSRQKHAAGRQHHAADKLCMTASSMEASRQLILLQQVINLNPNDGRLSGQWCWNTPIFFSGQLRLIQTSTMTIQLDDNSYGSPSPSSLPSLCQTPCRQTLLSYYVLWQAKQESGCNMLLHSTQICSCYWWILNG